METKRFKSKGGRPKQFQDAVTQPVRMERADVDRARTVAERDGVTLAEILRRGVLQYLKRRGV